MKIIIEYLDLQSKVEIDDAMLKLSIAEPQFLVAQELLAYCEEMLDKYGLKFNRGRFPMEIFGNLLEITDLDYYRKLGFKFIISEDKLNLKNKL